MQIDNALQHKQAIWDAISDRYAAVQEETLKMVRYAPLSEAVVEAVEDWRRRGHEGQYGLQWYPSASLWMPVGESHAMMVQAIAVVSMTLQRFGIPVEWTVENDPEYGQRTHKARVAEGHALAGLSLRIAGYLTGVACIRIPDGEPTVVETQPYRYVCPDDPEYANAVAANA